MATARLERRLSAILAADVVGYSRLMEHDEAGTFERLKQLRKDLIEPILERYGCRFIDLKGDGTIVEFGSVISTVEAAVEIQGRCWPRIPICLRASASATGSGSTSAT
jgi:class 3 adenylate cyclase